MTLDLVEDMRYSSRNLVLANFLCNKKTVETTRRCLGKEAVLTSLESEIQCGI